jgi:YgiT-type zinc finger domain-containing protein
MKPTKRKTYKCPSCGVGRTRIQRIAHELVSKQGKRVVIPDLDVEVCDHCGERVFDLAAVRQIEAYKRYSGRVLLRLDPELHRRLAELAKAHHRSLNEEMNLRLRESLSHVAKGEPERVRRTGERA